MDSKNKISIITNIEVNINQNNSLVKPNNPNIINFNINNGNQRPTTMKKPTATPFVLPLTQISNNPGSPNILISTKSMNLKPNDFNKPRNLQTSQLFNDYKIVIKDTTLKRDAETQTEEIFFKMYNLKYEIILKSFIESLK